VLEEKEKALQWLERAVEEGFQRPRNAAPVPEFAALEDDPRYVAFLNRIASP